MKVLGIISEYNPFHNGHKYQIEKSKEITGCDCVVAVMSGSFVQRGEPALFDKWTRAKMALLNGVDLVLELPAFYVLQYANAFAYGGVKVLDSLGVVNYLSFGSEMGDVEKIKKIANLMGDETETFKQNLNASLKEGMSYPMALETAISMEPGFEDMGEKLFSPNNTLGINYVCALNKIGSKIEPITVKRVGSAYHDDLLNDRFASASGIRNAIKEGEGILDYVPESNEFINDADMFSDENLESLILGYFRTRTPEEIENVPGMEDGLANRFISIAKTSNNLSDFFSALTSKRHTLSRIKRICYCALMGITDDKKLDYIRVLGFTEKGRELLKEANKRAKYPIVTKVADFTPGDDSMFKYDILATELSYLANNNKIDRVASKDYTTSPLFIYTPANMR